MKGPPPAIAGLPRRWLVALTAAALVGLGGGVGTALVADDAGTDVDPSSVNDPLRLGIPLVSLGCNGQAVLVLGSGDTAAALTAPVSSAASTVRYLRTDESCGTRWAAGGEAPSYVAYLGPYEDETRPCEIRMDGDLHARDAVTNLVAGTPDFVNCACVLPDSAAPTLTRPVGRPLADPDTVTWVTLLQQMLSKAADSAGGGQAGDTGDEDARTTGTYDDATARRVRAFQADNALLANGDVDEATWNALKDVACPLYDY